MLPGERFKRFAACTILPNLLYRIAGEFRAPKVFAAHHRSVKSLISDVFGRSCPADIVVAIVIAHAIPMCRMMRVRGLAAVKCLAQQYVNKPLHFDLAPVANDLKTELEITTRKHDRAQITHVPFPVTPYAAICISEIMRISH